MKTLILNGSPRKHGDTAALLDELKRHLAGDIVEISAYRDKISPCVDCRYCWKQPGCAIHDDMQRVYDAVETFDNVVIASPIYYSQLPGPLLSLASRFQTYYSARKFRGSPVRLSRKKGALILTGGGDGSHKPAQEMAVLLFRVMNASCEGVALSLHTNDTPAAGDDAALRQVRALALALNEGAGGGN